MITREDVADLQPGDVVELRDDRAPDAVLRGSVELVDSGTLGFGIPTLTLLHIGQATGNEHHTLTVVSRAPRPLYINHPRTEPVPGDVATNANPNDGTTWRYAPMSIRVARGWQATHDPDGIWLGRETLPVRLRLLVDGETGQVVP